MPDEKSGSDGAFLNLLANPRQIDVAGAYGQANALAHGIWQNRLAQAQQASGEAQQAAIDPATGEYSPNAYRQNLAARGPQAALAAQSGLASNQSLSTDQLNQALTKLGWVNNASGAAIKAGDYSDGAMMRIMQDGAAGGVLTMPEIMRQLATMPPDPAGRKQWLEQHQMRAMSTQQQLEQTYGTTGTQTGPGGSTIGTVQAPASAGGAVSAVPQAGAPQGLTPSEATAPTPIGVTPQGAPVYGTRQQFIDRVGGALGTGRLPAGLRNPAAAQPPAGADQPVGVVTGVGPAQSSAMAATGGQSATAFQDITAKGTQAQGQGAILSNMLADTASFVPGPGTDASKRFKAAMVTWAAPLARALGVNPDNVSAQESFDKLAAQIADAQGAGSDARLAVNQAANPGSHLTQAGVDLILRQLQGNADYLQARAALGAKWPGKDDVAGFQDQIGSKLNPQVFQYNRMVPDQRHSWFAGLSRQDKDKFKADYRWAEQGGLIGGAQ